MSDLLPFVIEDGLVKQGDGIRCATATELALAAEVAQLRRQRDAWRLLAETWKNVTFLSQRVA